LAAVAQVATLRQMVKILFLEQFRLEAAAEEAWQLTGTNLTYQAVLIPAVLAAEHTKLQCRGLGLRGKAIAVVTTDMVHRLQQQVAAGALGQ
jgi:hypothetical protein